MNWKELFSSRILDRGFDYYLCNAVSHLEVSEDCVTAKVAGTENYQVEIYFDYDEIVDMYCSCPYAEDGNYCKQSGVISGPHKAGWKEIRRKGSGPDIDPGNRSGDRNGFSGRYSDEGRTSASKFSADCRREHIGNGYAEVFETG